MKSPVRRVYSSIASCTKYIFKRFQTVSVKNRQTYEKVTSVFVLTLFSRFVFFPFFRTRSPDSVTVVDWSNGVIS